MLNSYYDAVRNEIKLKNLTFKNTQHRNIFIGTNLALLDWSTKNREKMMARIYLPAVLINIIFLSYGFFIVTTTLYRIGASEGTDLSSFPWLIFVIGVYILTNFSICYCIDNICDRKRWRYLAKLSNQFNMDRTDRKSVV